MCIVSQAEILAIINAAELTNDDVVESNNIVVIYVDIDAIEVIGSPRTSSSHQIW